MVFCWLRSSLGDFKTFSYCWLFCTLISVFSEKNLHSPCFTMWKSDIFKQKIGSRGSKNDKYSLKNKHNTGARHARVCGCVGGCWPAGGLVGAGVGVCGRRCGCGCGRVSCVVVGVCAGLWLWVSALCAGAWARVCVCVGLGAATPILLFLFISFIFQKFKMILLVFR